MHQITTENVEIRKSQNGGNGVFATKNINKGDVILFEKFIVFENENSPGEAHIPLAVRLAVRIIIENHLNTLKNIGFRAGLWTKKPPKDHKQWMLKVSSSGLIKPKELLEAYRISCAYNISIGAFLGQDGKNLLIHRRIVISHILCMANHSCSPNSRLISPNTKEEIKDRASGLIAIRDIRKDEEITFSYLSNMEEGIPEDLSAQERKKLSPLQHCSLNERRIRIQQDYGFLCKCARCTFEKSIIS